MPNSQNPDTQFALLQSENFTQYLLREPREIAFMLRQLAAKRALVTAVFGGDQDFLLTTVVQVAEDNASLLLDLGRDKQLISKAVAGGHLLCDTQLDKVRIQFELDDMEVTEYEHFPALRTPLPTALLRLQRREYYRLTVPIAGDLLCSIPLPDGQKITVRIIDISGGGVALMVSPANSPFAPGVVLKDCSMALPGSTVPFKFSMEVRNLFRITRRDGTEMVRAGCVFMDMPMSVANQIQRYILRAEQERASRGGV
jgi:flagellar brake protein